MFRRTHLFLPALLFPLLQLLSEPLHQDLVVVILPVELPDLSLDVLQVLPQLVEGMVHGLATLMDQVDPSMQVADHVLQVFQLLYTFFVLCYEPFGS